MTQTIHIPKEIKAAKTILIIIAVYVICGVPYGINFVYKLVSESQDDDSSDSKDRKITRKLVTYLCYSVLNWNSVFDPLIFFYRMKDFRSGVQKLFKYSNDDDVFISVKQISSDSRRDRVFSAPPQFNISETNNVQIDIPSFNRSVSQM